MKEIISELLRLAQELIARPASHSAPTPKTKKDRDHQWYRDNWNEYKKEHPKTKIKSPIIKLEKNITEKEKLWTDDEWREYKRKYPDTEIKPRFKKQ